MPISRDLARRRDTHAPSSRCGVAVSDARRGRNSPYPMPAPVAIDDEHRVVLAGGPDPADQWPVIMLKGLNRFGDFGAMFIDAEGTRVLRSFTGKGDHIWRNPSDIPDALKLLMVQWRARHPDDKRRLRRVDDREIE